MIDMVDVVTVYGSIGLSLLLIAFILNLGGRLSRDGYTYSLLNAVGGLTLAHYALIIGVIIFFVLEGIWGLVSLYRLIRLLTSGRN